MLRRARERSYLLRSEMGNRHEISHSPAPSICLVCAGTSLWLGFPETAFMFGDRLVGFCVAEVLLKVRVCFGTDGLLFGRFGFSETTFMFKDQLVAF